MDVRHASLHGMIIFTPTPILDDRGFFTRTFDANAARLAGLEPNSLVQDSQSRSHRGVLRGLHFRRDGGEGKLVRCARGSVLDVAVDLRPWSPSFRHSVTVVLDDVDHVSVWLPPGLGHGFLVTSAVADVCYRIDREYRSDVSDAIRWDDPDLAVQWPLDRLGGSGPTLSSADRAAPLFRVIEPLLADYFPEPR
jgi:dTDP-4-dehydrorhamnose 3,5-epimerase